MTMIEDRPMTMPEGKVDGTKYHAQVTREDGKVPWYVPGKGWTCITPEDASSRQAAHAAAFSAQARAAQEARFASKRPSKWPPRHQALLTRVREMATSENVRWNYNPGKDPAHGVPAGGLLLIFPDGTDLEFDSLDAAAADLVGQDIKVKRTGKAELVRFLTRIIDVLPADEKAEACRLVAEA